ncbi:flagellin lysine-N-methylase [Paenibacillus illinoisensis]|uniref:Flagellin lysine-N-methylase n=1 Tax=Paenibacillus illinoisensis TaxID=59845 RepID=A0ABW8HYC9_9BACL
MTTRTPKTRTILVPRYMQQFACIGSVCEDSCCVGWRVDIDQSTYKKYNKSRDIELKPLFEKNIVRHRVQANERAYAKLKMDDSGRCTFLNEDNLCKVQLGLGEDYLSNTCSTYPRYINRVNGVVEKSTTVSCPEAARLALLNPNGIEFDQTEEEISSKGFLHKELTTNDINNKNKAQAYFWDLRIFTIQVLQRREYSLSDRLIILGLFYQKVQQAVDESNFEQIPGYIESYNAILEDMSMKDSLNQIPSNLAIQMKLCKELVDFRFGQGIHSSRYLQCLAETLNGIEYTSEAIAEEIAARYQQACKEHYEPFMNEHEYILENYLVNYVFKNLFPFGKKKLYNDFVMLVVHYSMIKLHLIGMAGYHKGLTTELVIKLIQSFAKTVEHNGTYLNKVFALLEDNEYTTMAYMTVLIKN